MPSLIDSGVSPFHQIGAGSETATVTWPGLSGLATGWEPLAPDISQLPIISAADAAAGIIRAAAAAVARAMNVERVSNRPSLSCSQDPETVGPDQLQHLAVRPARAWGRTMPTNAADARVKPAHDDLPRSSWPDSIRPSRWRGEGCAGQARA